ncbi:cyclin-A2-like [Prorops nasuta]|uniref:cyclin-A2-like n=1 Tax=Prorops nasuta TaxID=863751 RepID=UPI0034CFE627
MATFRVHEDQENRIAEIRRGKENIPMTIQNQAMQQSKRAVLGVIQNNCLRNTKQDILKDEKFSKAKPTIPAQLEPFIVYKERKDEVSFKIYEDKLEEETSVVLRETIETKEVNVKQEVLLKIEAEKPTLEVNPIINSLEEFANNLCKSSPDGKNEVYNHESPMALDKSAIFSSSKKREQDNKKDSLKKYRINFFDVDEYRADIYNYLRCAEMQHRPKPGYMRKQPDITYSMRSILVDWLVEVAEEYRLQTETLYLAVSYIDRFLSCMSVVRGKLQLVGTAAMFIAAKYEEIYPPDVGEFVYITDDTYSKKQVLRMEHLILRVLCFDLTVPTPLTFLMGYCISNNLSEKIRFLAMYLCELSLLEGDPYLQYVPSLLAASAVALARHTLQEEAWPHELELSTGYSFRSLKDCISCLSRTFANAPNIKQQAIQEKYRSSKYGYVSMLLPRCTEAFSSEDDSEST